MVILVYSYGSQYYIQKMMRSEDGRKLKVEFIEWGRIRQRKRKEQKVLGSQVREIEELKEFGLCKVREDKFKKEEVNVVEVIDMEDCKKILYLVIKGLLVIFDIVNLVEWKVDCSGL